MAEKAKAVITAPFTALKPGVKYSYTRPTWPAPQAGTEHKKTEFTAEVKPFNYLDAKGVERNTLRVQINGGPGYHDIKDLPADATFTEI